MLDNDIVVKSNPSGAITSTFGQIILRQVWTLLFSRAIS